MPMNYSLYAAGAWMTISLIDNNFLKQLIKMKSKIFLAAGLTILLFSCQTIQGQVNFGIKAGMNLETQSELGQLWDNNEIRAGFLVGGTVEYVFNDRLSVQTELNFLQKGEQHSTSKNGTNSDIQEEFNYITVPLFIKASFSEELGLSANWNLYGYAGPYYSYLISADYKVKENGETSVTDVTDDSVKDDLGIVLGGGLSYKLKNGNAIYTDLRYDMGLYEISNVNSDLRNKAINLGIGYRF